MKEDTGYDGCILAVAGVRCSVVFSVRGKSTAAFGHVVGADTVPFLQSMANCPLHLLSVVYGERVTFDAAVMSHFFQFTQLGELSVSVGTTAKADWMDWTEPTLLASLNAARCQSPLSAVARCAGECSVSGRYRVCRTSSPRI